MKYARLPLLTLLGLAVVATGCGAPAGEEAASENASADCIEDHDPDTDYFPDKLSVDHAENLSIEYANDHQIVTVDEPSPDTEAESYVLLRCGAPEPELDGALADAPVIEVPVRSVFSASTTHLSLFTYLEQADVVSGVADGSVVNDEEIREGVDSGDIVDYAGGGALDQELAIAEAPDLLMTGGTEEAEYQTLRDADIPIVANAEWLENSPLGRAEWVKLAAALTGTEEEATELFDEIADDYDAVADQVSDADPVDVVPGQMFDGAWNVVGGGSYVGRLLADAGGTHPWDDTEETGSIEMDLEEVLAEVQDAEVWISSEHWETYDDMTADDERYTEFTAFEEDAVWTNNNNVGPGGNLYWDEGVLRPDLVLADLATILHPELMDDHEMVYYRSLDD